MFLGVIRASYGKTESRIGISVVDIFRISCLITTPLGRFSSPNPPLTLLRVVFHYEQTFFFALSIFTLFTRLDFVLTQHYTHQPSLKMSAPSYASVAKEDERVADSVFSDADKTQVGDELPKTESTNDTKSEGSDKGLSVDSEAASAALTPAPPPSVNAWKIKSDAVVAPPSFDDKRDTSPSAPKMKMGKGEKWVPYTPTLVMNGGKRGGRKGASAPNGSQPAAQGGAPSNRRKSKPRAPHGDKKETEPVAESGGEGSSSEKRKMRYNYRKNYYKNDFQPQTGFYQPPGAYEYALSLIIGQVEYYFSVENLCKDLFMRKQMNSEGLVPLTLIAGFNRVKALAHDPAVFMQACRFAPSLQVVGDRIRLSQGWEQWVLPADERDEAGKVEDVDPEAEAFPGVGVEVAEPPRVSFDVANATPFVPKRQ